MTDSISFNARACCTTATDRIYRVELRNGFLYFLRIGGQFDLDRGIHQPAGAAGVLLLAAGEALLRKHKKEEMVARDPNRDPEELLGIHPHNFKLGSANIASATLLPKKGFLALFRPHFGRLIIEQIDGNRQEFHFERLDDLRKAFEHLPALLGDKLDSRIHWDKNQGRFLAKKQ